MLPIDGDYPGGRTGIGIDTYPEYLGLDTAHGVTPYFGDPSVVTNPNALDFPGGFARRPRRMAGLRQMALAEDEEGEGDAAEGPSRHAGGIYSYGPYSEVHIPVLDVLPSAGRAAVSSFMVTMALLRHMFARMRSWVLISALHAGSGFDEARRSLLPVHPAGQE